MMDYRPRQIATRLTELARHFKVVLLTGARQVGKSTLLSRTFPELKMLTFDPLQDLFGARRDPDLFLDNFPPPLILDEIQFAPELLPAIKRRVDRSDAPGQYFLSGSQQLAVLKGVSESMAGRVGILHLSPMTLHEAAGRGSEQPWLERYLAGEVDPAALTSGLLPVEGGPARQLWRGMLPATLDLPDSILPDYFGSYVETYIQRDIRQQAEIRDVMAFARFVSLAGALTAQEINASQLGRELGIVPTTARHWLDMLAACFQWRELPAYSGNAVKRVASKRKGLIADSGLACWLQRISSPDALAASPMLGAMFETFALDMLLAQGEAMPIPPRAWHWRLTSGAEVDLVLERDGRLFPIEVKCKTQLEPRDWRGIKRFREAHGERVATGIIVYAGGEARRLSKDAIAMPWNAQ
jgi:predicted AAA+ superfamily ATPase